MKNLIIKFICFFVPMFIIKFFAKHKLAKAHEYPPTTLIHRRKAKIIYEIEFNWYDNDMLPISIVREVHSGKTFSVSYYEMFDFKEFQGRDRSVGNTIADNYDKEK